MLMLLVQTFLLLLAAFLTGAALACLLKRAIRGESIPVREPAVTEKAAVPSPIAAQGVSDGDRFGRALSGGAPDGAPAKQTTPPTPRAPAAGPAASAAPVVEVQPTPPPRPVAPPPPPPAPVVALPVPPPPPPAPLPVAAAAAAAVAAVAAAAKPVAASPAAAPVAPQLQPAPAPPPAVAAAVPAAFTSLAMDDLTRIKGIDAVVQSRINALGVRRYWQIASWDGDDLNRMSQSLGAADRIQQEDWVGQARVLASGAETDFATRRRLGHPEPEEVAAAEAARAAEAAKAVAPAIATDPVKSTEPAVDPGAARVAEIAKAAEAAKTADAAKAEEAAKAAVAENAAAAARFAAATAAAKTASPSVSPPSAPAVQASAPGTIASVATAAATSIAAATAAAASASLPAAKPAVTESPAAPPPAKPAETETQAPPAAAEPRTDLTHLRSVRSEALRSEPVAPSGRASGAFDDLKRIRGVGVLIEKKLNSLGVTAYEQVANWTSADIDRVSQLLDFKGRIERENWVEQARILASGGQTEFSRRVDRGEVETSR